MSLFKKNIYLCNSKNERCRILLVGQVTTLSLSKQGFESPIRYSKKRIVRSSPFFYFNFNTFYKKNVNYTNN